MNPRSFLGALGVAAIVASSAVAASAQIYAPQPNAQPGYGYRQGSLVNVGNIAQNASRTIAGLQRDQRDYGGHRVAAINDLQNASNELNAAVQFASTHGYQMPVQRPPVYNPNRTIRQPQMAPRYSRVQRDQQKVQRWINHLQRDSRDFGGHRAAAINWLQQAENELTAAEQFANAHGYQ